MGKLAPVVIVQADPITQAGLTRMIVVLLTTQARPGTRALRVPIRSRDRLLCGALRGKEQTSREKETQARTQRSMREL